MSSQPDRSTGHYRPDGLEKKGFDRHKAKTIGRLHGYRPYKCGQCGDWHLATIKPKHA